MKISHHPSEELLVSYASGSMMEPVALVVATHLAMCPACRRIVADAEAAGGALLEELQPQILRPDALNNALERLNNTHGAPAQKSRSNFGAPEPLNSYLSRPLDETKWIHVTPWLAIKPLTTRGGTRAQLIRSAPGSGVSLHTHRGEELTLVLQGGFSDEYGHYGPGDLQTATPETQHTPIADMDSYCINLAVTDAPLVFKNWSVGVIAKLFGF